MRYVELARQPSRLRGEYNKEVEAAAVASDLEWVGLRSGSYAANSIGTWAGQIRGGDVVRGPYPESAWAPLHERDIAAVGAHALLTDELGGRRPVLTGPQSHPGGNGHHDRRRDRQAFAFESGSGYAGGVERKRQQLTGEGALQAQPA